MKEFVVIVKLSQLIYGQKGYYCEWDNRILLLLMSKNGLSGDSINLISKLYQFVSVKYLLIRVGKNIKNIVINLISDGRN